MADPRDKIELSAQALRAAGVDPRRLPAPDDGGGEDQGQAEDRSWISVYFECCKVYCRVYINAGGSAYIGWCPRCAARIEVRVAADGSPGRFFRAT